MEINARLLYITTVLCHATDGKKYVGLGGSSCYLKYREATFECRLLGGVSRLTQLHQIPWRTGGMTDMVKRESADRKMCRELG